MITIYPFNQVSPAQVFARPEGRRDVAGTVSAIIEEVRRHGDDALLHYAQQFDGAQLTHLEVPGQVLDQAVADLAPDFRTILEEAAENIRDFHRRQVRNSFVISEKDGVILRPRPCPRGTPRAACG